MKFNNNFIQLRKNKTKFETCLQFILRILFTCTDINFFNNIVLYVYE